MNHRESSTMMIMLVCKWHLHPPWSSIYNFDS